MAEAMRGAEKPLQVEEPCRQLLSLAVHEMRTPASVVGGYLRMLQSDAGTLTERQRHMVDEAARSCAKLVDLLAQLSDLRKLDSGEAPIAHRPIDFFTLVRDVAAAVHEGDDREVHLTVRGPDTGASIAGDPQRLGAALDAIFRAILREQPSGRTIVADRRVVADGAGRAAALVIAGDDSVQNAYDQRHDVFDDLRGGLGLALPIARRVIAAHGGRLWAPAPAHPSSTAGKGAAVFVLPLE